MNLSDIDNSSYAEKKVSLQWQYMFLSFAHFGSVRPTHCFLKYNCGHKID